MAHNILPCERILIIANRSKSPGFHEGMYIGGPSPVAIRSIQQHNEGHRLFLIVELAGSVCVRDGWFAECPLSRDQRLEADVAFSTNRLQNERMAQTQHTFKNQKDGPIYISVEPWPECFELEPGDKLTLKWEADATGDVMQIDFINDRELVVWPNGSIDDIQFWFNGEPGEDRSWTFKHR